MISNKYDFFLTTRTPKVHYALSVRCINRKLQVVSFLVNSWIIIKSMRVKSMVNVCTIKIHAVKINLFSKLSNLSEKKQVVKVEENKVTEATPASKILNILVLHFFCNFYQHFVVDFFAFWLLPGRDKSTINSYLQ